MTEIQVQLYISQIVWVSPLERIRYYLRDIKHVLFSFFVKNYETQEEIEEEVEKVKEIKPKSKLSKREQIIADCEKLGLKLPKR